MPSVKECCHKIHNLIHDTIKMFIRDFNSIQTGPKIDIKFNCPYIFAGPSDIFWTLVLYCHKTCFLTQLDFRSLTLCFLLNIMIKIQLSVYEIQSFR